MTEPAAIPVPSNGARPPAEGSLNLRLRVPDYVVYRPFAAETVVMNLQTGNYHGLNPTAGKMLEAIDQSEDVRAAAALAAADLEHPVEEVERDICALCDELLERGLVEPD